MNQLPPLQQILGTDKKNPVFTIYRDANEQILHVYYGGRLLEKVPDDKGHPEYKLLLARLFNAGVKAKALEDDFGVDHKTMKRWGSALKSGDPELLMRVLAGREANRKLSLEIRSYIEMRFPTASNGGRCYLTAFLHLMSVAQNFLELYCKRGDVIGDVVTF